MVDKINKKAEKVKTVKKPKVQFTLESLIYRKRKVDITADVVIEDDVHTDYKIGWVELRGQQDPQSLVDASLYLEEYKDAIADAADLETEEERAKFTADATARFMAASVAICITRWDNKLFNNRKFDREEAIELLSKKENFRIYNQLALALEEASDFLPKSSQQQ